MSDTDTDQDTEPEPEEDAYVAGIRRMVEAIHDAFERRRK